jgi:hypothetical protein
MKPGWWRMTEELRAFMGMAKGVLKQLNEVSFSSRLRGAKESLPRA